MSFAHPRLLLLLPAAAALFFTGCVEEVTYERDYRGGYYGEPGYDTVDVYYEGDVPYSRDYGPLYYRSGQYYYLRNNNYYIYDRPVRHRVDHRRSERDSYAAQRYRNQEKIQEYRDRQVYNSNRNKVATYQYQNRNQQAAQRYQQQQAYNRNQVAVKQYQYQQRQKVQQYQAQHAPAKKKEKKDD